MIKALLLDVDGVVIKPRKRFFSEILAERQGISIDVVLLFFKNEYKACVLGKAFLEEEVAKYLSKWKWNASVKELLEFWFSHESEIDEDVLSYVKEIRTKGVKVYLTSDHSVYRKGDMMERMHLKDHVDGTFFSCDVGHTKEELAFYNLVLEELNVQPTEIVFLDDEKENVDAAQKTGINARLYTNVQDLESISI